MSGVENWRRFVGLEAIGKERRWKVEEMQTRADVWGLCCVSPLVAVCAWSATGWSLVLWELHVALGHLGVARGGGVRGCLVILRLLKKGLLEEQLHRAHVL